MIYLKTKLYSGLSFRRTRPFTGYRVSGADDLTETRSGLPSACGPGDTVRT